MLRFLASAALLVLLVGGCVGPPADPSSGSKSEPRVIRIPASNGGTFVDVDIADTAKLVFRSPGLHEVSLRVGKATSISNYNFSNDGPASGPHSGVQWALFFPSHVEAGFPYGGCSGLPSEFRVLSLAAWGLDNAYSRFLEPGGWTFLVYIVENGWLEFTFDGANKSAKTHIVTETSPRFAVTEVLRPDVRVASAAPHNQSFSTEVVIANRSIFLGGFGANGGPFIYPQSQGVMLKATTGTARPCIAKARTVFPASPQSAYEMSSSGIVPPSTYGWAGHFAAAVATSTSISSRAQAFVLEPSPDYFYAR